MQQAIESCRGHDRVARKDFGPVTEGFIRGEDDGTVVIVALRDDLKEEIGLCLIQCKARAVEDLVVLSILMYRRMELVDRRRTTWQRLFYHRYWPC